MKRKTKLRLGVNIDHVATLRQVRGGTTPYPDLLMLAGLAIRGGADLITVHLREDRRHIQDADVELLAKKLPLPLNLEIATTRAMMRKALKYRPEKVCLVPEKREELTTEGGLNLKKRTSEIKKVMEELQSVGIELSLFIDPSLDQVKLARQLEADAVEFHTGTWVLATGDRKKREWERLKKSANLAHELGLAVHAGHGLSYSDVAKAARIPYVEELNIGHSLVCYALEMGLQKSVRQMKRRMLGL